MTEWHWQIKFVESSCWFDSANALSALLRAMADQLIPGLPINIRIAILQQTADEDGPSSSGANDKTVIQTVIEGDPYRNRLLDETKGERNATGSNFVLRIS